MKKHLSFTLALIFLLFSTVLPTSAEQSPVLTAVQSEKSEPGQALTLTLSLSDTTLAGGFLTLQYDTSLFSLTEATLLLHTDTLTLTYAQHADGARILLDAAQNVQIGGAFLSLRFASAEETQPGTYPLICTVPDPASFYALREDGSTYPLSVAGCTAALTVSTPTLPACPAQYLACQETAAQNGSVKVRVCALVQDTSSLIPGSYGFHCSITDLNGTHSLTPTGSALTDQITGGTRTYTSDELGGKIYTATLSIPAEGEVRITLSPYVYLQGQTLFGGSYTLIYQNGVYEKTVFS